MAYPRYYNRSMKHQTITRNVRYAVLESNNDNFNPNKRPGNVRPGVFKKEDNMNQMNAASLTEITDEFVMQLGVRALQDIDTPSFMRREYRVEMVGNDRPPHAGRIQEPDEKIVRFLSVIKRKDFAVNAG